MTAESADETLDSDNLSNRDPNVERRSGEDRRIKHSPTYFSNGGAERRAQGERRKRWERRKGYMRITS